MNETYYNEKNSHMIGTIIKTMTKDMKYCPILNINKLILSKNDIGIDDDIIEVLKLCLVYRPFSISNEYIENVINIVNDIDNLL